MYAVIISLITLASSVVASNPSDVVTLITPQSQVNVNETVPIGWVNGKALRPFWLEVDVSVTLPNTTTILLGGQLPDPCQYFPGTSISLNFLVNQTGT